ncbi:MAG: DUF2203 domain-containing protein [Candidatus Rokubacteria bacterium]|nr:DUF2203 domain-containing protein [Candidatus Rokubacteria bacterium]
MADRYFSPEEVEALVPDLTRLMGEVMDRHGAVQALGERVREERQRLTMAGGGMPSASWREDAARLERLLAEVQARLKAIGALGGVVKDLGQGLVDFPHLREGREVNLCWKYGETAIRFWHGLDEGFAGRQPL